MLQTYQKTKSLLHDLGYEYKCWNEVPAEFKTEIYNEFVRETHPSDFSDYISDRYAQEAYAILLSAPLDDKTCFNFSIDRKNYFKQKCDDILDELFYEAKPSYFEIQEYNKEMKDEWQEVA